MRQMRRACRSEVTPGSMGIYVRTIAEIATKLNSVDPDESQPWIAHRTRQNFEPLVDVQPSAREEIPSSWFSRHRDDCVLYRASISRG